MTGTQPEELTPLKCRAHPKLDMVWRWGVWSGELMWTCPLAECRSMAVYESERRDRKPWSR